jgi:hypothetical protein
MAINFTVSYTFAPNTTIASAQVNTNTSDNASVWQGLEALTKTFAKLKVDVDPSTALEVATKQYVDHYSTWRRPVLQSASVTTVTVESGLDGTSGDIPILFSDGSVRTETSATRTTFDITRNAVLTTSGAQSGLRASLSEAANTWYALYAVKVTDLSTQWCTVGDTTLPLQSNYATLNSNFGTNGWVYLGMIRNGDNSGATSDILNFVQCGNTTVFKNVCTGNVINAVGLRLATSASATSLTYTTSSGTGTTAIPNHVTIIGYYAAAGTGSGSVEFGHGSVTEEWASGSGGARFATRLFTQVADAKLTNGSASSMDIHLFGWIDGVLGVGSNPLI